MGSKKKSKQMKEETTDIDNLEKLHRTMKREREAWEKLIENLNELQIKNKKKGPENPSNI
jgi:rubrerythrin